MYNQTTLPFWPKKHSFSILVTFKRHRRPIYWLYVCLLFILFKKHYFLPQIGKQLSKCNLCTQPMKQFNYLEMIICGFY